MAGEWGEEMKPRLLDLFCGAGGAAKGYQRAGFYVVGVDNRPQPRYCGDEFHQADALEFLEVHGREYDVIHASPPCQIFSQANRKARSNHLDLLTPIRNILKNNYKFWIIENVKLAPMEPYTIELCGLMFRLKVFRHRLFQISHAFLQPNHPSHKGYYVGTNMYSVAGHGGSVKGRLNKNVPNPVNCWADAMAIDWMTRAELSQAIPPAYTEWIGKRIMEAINDRP